MTALDQRIEEVEAENDRRKQAHRNRGEYEGDRISKQWAEREAQKRAKYLEGLKDARDLVA